MITGFSKDSYTLRVTEVYANAIHIDIHIQEGDPNVIGSAIGDAMKLTEDYANELARLGGTSRVNASININMPPVIVNKNDECIVNTKGEETNDIQ
jgi:hypothetical protein